MKNIVVKDGVLIIYEKNTLKKILVHRGEDFSAEVWDDPNSVQYFDGSITVIKIS